MQWLNQHAVTYGGAVLQETALVSSVVDMSVPEDKTRKLKAVFSHTVRGSQYLGHVQVNYHLQRFREQSVPINTCVNTALPLHVSAVTSRLEINE